MSGRAAFIVTVALGCAMIAASVVAELPAAHESHSARSHARIGLWPPLATAGPFLLADIRMKIAGHWAEEWRSLYPEHQRVASRDAYVRCERATPWAAPLKSVHLVRVRRSMVDIPGRKRPVPGVAVTVAVAVLWYGPRDPITFRHTFHLVPVRGRWRWLLSAQRYRLYNRDACSYQPPA